MLVKEGEEAPSAPSRQNADRDAQAARRAGSYTSTLDKAMGPSGEGARLQELVMPSGPHCLLGTTDTPYGLLVHRIRSDTCSV